MAITRKRFEFALKSISGSDWQAFEHLSSAFLTGEFPNLRTTANSSGDGGRDAELFSPSGIPDVVVQYSTRKDWQKKIKETAARLRETIPDSRVLIFLTNQSIGAAADKLKSELMNEHKLLLDIRDISWFSDRLHADSQKHEAAAEFCRKFVDPILEEAGIETMVVASDLSNTEAKTALMFLEMQYRDTNAAYGLTKLSYDAFVKAALRGTSTEHRLSRAEVHAKVAKFLPQYTATQLQQPINSALERLSKGAVRHRKDNDEFHLSEGEIERLSNVAADISALRSALDDDVREIVSRENAPTPNSDAVIDDIRHAIDRYFMKKGEEFARMAVRGDTPKIDRDSLRDAVMETAEPKPFVYGRNRIEFISEAVDTLLATPSQATKEYLYLLSQSYTLFAFLAETPDVQKVSRQMFGHGEIWLDTSVVLPALAEHSRESDSQPFSTIFTQAKLLGLRLYITSGVLEEIERHINKCRTYAHSESWHGDTPYLYTQYMLSGGRKATFTSWIENFAGDVSPEEDIAEYLRQKFSIKVERPTEPKDVSSELSSEVRELWRRVHDARRGENEFNMMANRLASHDSENYLAVLQARHAKQGASPLGFTSWWLTMDSKARQIKDQLPSHLRQQVKGDPILSVDFLVRYLAFGPNREKIDQSGAANISLIYSGEILESLPQELLKVATDVREECAHLPEHVIRRRIRDRLNREKARSGIVEKGGLDSALTSIRGLR